MKMFKINNLTEVVFSPCNRTFMIKGLNLILEVFIFMFRSKIQQMEQKTCLYSIYFRYFIKGKTSTWPGNTLLCDMFFFYLSLVR